MAITRSQIARQLLAEGGAPRQGFQMGSNVDEFRQPIAYDEFRRPIFYEDFQTQNQSDNDEDDRGIVDRARDFVSGNRQGILGSVLGSAIFGLPGAILGGFLGRRRDQGFGMFESARDRDARIAQETIAENFRQKQMAEEAARQLANRETGSITSAFGQTIDPGDLSVGFDSDTGQSFSEYSDPGTAASYEGSFADGGDVRQRYGLGKLVKKITRTVKKVAKSPIGKAAITGAALFGIPGTPFKGFGKSLPFELPAFLEGNTGKAIAGIVGASALAGMTAPKEEEQESLSQRIADRTGLDIAAIRKEVQDAYTAGDISGLRTKYPFLIPTTAAAAEGGRIGFEDGGKSKEYDFEDYLRDRKKIDEFFDRENKFKQFKEDMLRFKKTREVTAANGGGIKMASNLENEEVLESLFEKYLEMGLSPKDAADKARQEFDKMSKAKKSDRIMAKNGGEISIGQIEMLIKRGADNDLIKTYIDGVEDGVIDQIRESMKKREKKQDGGLMNLAGNEMDLRGGGFVPIGRKEKADDVPARLSKNEFVFTADAVRAAGGGSVDRGADLMYKTMKQLENKVA